MIEWIKKKLRAIIKQAILISLDDSGTHQVGVFRYMGNDQKAVIMTPYGLYSKAPNGSFSVVMQVGGKESNQLAFVMDAKNRPNLQDGEVALFDSVNGKHIIIKANGDIEIKGNKEIVLSSTGITIDGTDFATHTHAVGTLAAPNGACTGITGAVN
jgi:phage gp45-like